MFGTIKSNLIILAVALVAMFAAIAADAQTIEVTSGSLKSKVNYDGTRTQTVNFNAKVEGVRISTTQTIKDKSSSNTTKISKSFKAFGGAFSATPVITLNSNVKYNGANKIDTSVKIKKSVGSVDFTASTYSVVRNNWDFNASTSVGNFDLSVSESLNFDSGSSASKYAVDYNIEGSKYKITTSASDNGSFAIGFKKGY